MSTDHRDHEFEQAVTAMLHRRALDVPATSQSFEAPLGGTARSVAARRFIPLSIAAAFVIVAGLVAVSLLRTAPVDERLQTVSAPTPAPETTAPLATPGPETSATRVPVGPGTPAEFFDRSGNSLGAAYLSEIDGTTIVLDPIGTDLVDLTLATIGFRADSDGANETIAVLGSGGLRIDTTIDPVTQALAQSAVDDFVPANDRNLSMTLIALDPATGEILAAAGTNGTPTATAERRMGSAFQMFVLSTAISDFGAHPDDLISGVGPCSALGADGEAGPVENFGRSTGSEDTLRNQLKRSSRCAFVRLLDLADSPEGFEPARALRRPTSERLVQASASPLEALTVGPRFNPLHVAQATAMLANGGVQPSAHLVTSATDPAGEQRWLPAGGDPTPQLTQFAVCATTSVLRSNVESGTGVRAQVPGQLVAGQTGTTADFTDAWFVGYTPHLVTVVWMGSLVPRTERPMTDVGGRDVTGGSYPAEAWGSFNRAWHEGRAASEFPNCADDQPSADDPLPPPGAEGSDACPPGFPVAIDDDADGIIDRCLPE